MICVETIDSGGLRKSVISPLRVYNLTRVITRQVALRALYYGENLKYRGFEVLLRLSEQRPEKPR